LKNPETFTSVIRPALLAETAFTEDAPKQPDLYSITSIRESARGASFVNVGIVFRGLTPCGWFDIELPGLSIP
jgi:hypothetical protein